MRIALTNTPIIVGALTPACGNSGVGVLVVTCAIGVPVAVTVGDGVGVDVAQRQLEFVVQDGFLQTPTQQTIDDGQSEFVLHVVPHCGTGDGVGDALVEGVGDGVAMVKASV